MQKSKRVILISLVSVFTCLSCSKESVEKRQESDVFKMEKSLVENLHLANQRKLLQKLFDQQFRNKLLGKSKPFQKQYFDKLNLLLSHSSNSSDDEKIVEMLGFTSMQDYVKWYNALAYEVAMFKKTLPSFEALPIEEKSKMMIDMIDDGKLPTIKSFYSGNNQSNNTSGLLVANDRGDSYYNHAPTDGGPAGKSPWCLPQYNACLGTADGNLILATAGCVGTVSIPVAGPFIGVSCEIGAIMVHRSTVLGRAATYNMCQ